MATETGKASPTGLDLEASRLRVRLLEVFWAGSGLGGRERRARLDAVLQESVGHLDPATRDRVVERVLEELARWTPADDVAAGGGGGEALREALSACLTRDKAPQADLSPEEKILIECVRAIVEHQVLESQNHLMLLRDVIKVETVSLPIEFLQVLRALVKEDPARDGAKGLERLKGLLRSLQIGQSALFSGARAAAGQALTKLVADLNPANSLGGARGGAKKGLEEFERTYERIAALSPEELRDRYFSDAYKREIKKATQA